VARKKKLSDIASAAEEIRKLAEIEKEASEVRNRVDANGRPVPFDIQYIEAAEDLFAAYDPRAIPFAETSMGRWEKYFKNIAIAIDEFENSYGGMFEMPLSYWLARDEAHAALFKQPPRIKLPDSPTLLKSYGVYPRQIARIWDWLDEEGAPDEERVARELENPGSELTDEIKEQKRHTILVQLGFVYQDKEHKAALI
jgi:hypothetical protein